MKQLFQNKNYVLLFFGFLVSELGNVIFGFAAGLYIADLTGRASMLSIFMALGAGVRIVMSPLGRVKSARSNDCFTNRCSFEWVYRSVFLSCGFKRNT